jgi:hypothetical protein
MHLAVAVAVAMAAQAVPELIHSTLVARGVRVEPVDRAVEFIITAVLFQVIASFSPTQQGVGAMAATEATFLRAFSSLTLDLEGEEGQPVLAQESAILPCS